MAQVQSPGKTSAHSPGKKCSPGFSEKDNIKKLSDLADKLAEIRKQKESLKAVNAYTKTKGDAPIIGDYSTRPKKLFNHPKLEHVYGQIVFSPYNFSPMVSD